MVLNPITKKFTQYRGLFLVLLIFFGIQAYGQLRINEVLASNTHIVFDPDYGDYADYIELYNPANSPMDISGYRLTDKLTKTAKWEFPYGTSIPANAYLMVWADGKDKVPGDQDSVEFSLVTPIEIEAFHANFKLSSEGEYIGLYNAAGELLDAYNFPAQLNNYSFGRIADTDLSWRSMEPSPNAENSNYHSDNFQISETEIFFSEEAGFYPLETKIGLSSSGSTGEIRYTLDGSTPTETSTIYTDSVQLLTHKVIKARYFEPGKLPGAVYTASFLIEPDFDLPVVSVSAAYDDLFGFGFGIFQNSYKNREIPLEIEYFSAAGNREFKIHAGGKLFGTQIFQFQQKPLSLSVKDKFGTDALAYPLFGQGKVVNYENFVLRNGGNDNPYTMFRDGLMSELIDGLMDVDYQDYSPVAAYVNGNFKGLYNLREKLNKRNILDRHRLPDQEMDLLEDSLAVSEGDASDFLELLDYVSDNTLSEQEHYDWVKSKIDIPSYQDYMIAKFYIGYPFYEYNNKYWKLKSEGAKWRWMLFDTEHGMGCCGGQAAAENTLEKHLNKEDLPEWSVAIFNGLMQNTAFRNEFVQKWAAHLNGTFHTERVLDIVEKQKERLEKVMLSHVNTYSTAPNSMFEWYQHVSVLEDFVLKRNHHMRKHILELFPDITDTVGLNITIEGVAEADFFVNGVLLADSLLSKGHYFKAIPFELEVVPKPGYKFLGWKDISTDAVLTLELLSDSTVTAVFEEEAFHALPDTIFTDTVLYAMHSPYYGLRDIVIMPNASLELGAGVQLLLSDHVNIYNYGALKSHGTEDSIVSIRPNPAVYARIPYYNDRPQWGSIVSKDATAGLNLKWTNILGAGTGRDAVREMAAISSYESDIYLNHVDIRKSMMPVYTEGGKIHVDSSAFYSLYTGDYINIKYTDSSTVNACIFEGNDALDADAIDYDGIQGGKISNNRIYGFFGSNSDGIDIGESCTDVEISGNFISHIFDKGVSVGQNSQVKLKQNLIAYCAQGIGVKDLGAMAELEFNTFFGNDLAIASFEKNPGRGGGFVTVNSSILAGSYLQDTWQDEKSELQISYTLSDKENLNGTNNYLLNPDFIHAGNYNFELGPNSPAINKADPALGGGRLGMHYENSDHLDFLETRIAISEMNYFSHSTFESGEWIELYNKGTEVIDLSGWILMSHDMTESFRIPEGTFIQADDYLVISDDLDRFWSYFPEMNNVIGEMSFNLDNQQDCLRLFDAARKPVNTVCYATSTPWESLVDNSFSLQLCNTEADNSRGESWYYSKVAGGSPGAKNGCMSLTVEEGELLLFPNPVLSDLHLATEVSGDSDISVHVYDTQARLIEKYSFKSTEDDQLISLNLGHLSTGLYWISLNTKSQVNTAKFVKL